MKSIDDNYITIQGWMPSRLNLKGAKLMTFALIYGFCQDGKTRFRGSISYISSWAGTSDRQVQKVLNELQDEKLIFKFSGNQYGVDVNEYGINFKEVERRKKFTPEKSSPLKKVRGTGEKSSGERVKKVRGTGEKSSPNNIVDNISDNIEDNISLYIQTHEEIKINPPKPEREVLSEVDVQTLKKDFRDFWLEKAAIFIEQMHTDGEKLYLIEPLQRKTGLTEQQIFKAAQQFAQDQIAKEEFNYPGYKAFKSHFYNWLPMHTKNLLKQWNGGSNSKTTKGISNDRRAFIDSIFTD